MLHKAVAHREGVIKGAQAALMADTMAFMPSLYWFDEPDFNAEGYYHLSTRYGAECRRAAKSQDFDYFIKDFAHLETSPFPSPICHLLASLPQLGQAGSKLLATLAERRCTTDALIALELFNTELRRYYSGVFPVILVEKNGTYFVVFPKVITESSMPTYRGGYQNFLIDQPFELSDQPQKDHLDQISKLQHGVRVKWFCRRSSGGGTEEGYVRCDEDKRLKVRHPNPERGNHDRGSWSTPDFVAGGYTVLK